MATFSSELRLASCEGWMSVVYIRRAFSGPRLDATIDSGRTGHGSDTSLMSIDVYWGSGSPFSWRVLLALELKRLPYANHLLQFSKQEHKSPQMLSLNF